MKQVALILSLIITLFLMGCASTGETPSDKRETILTMEEDVLTELYEVKPSTKSFIKDASGYAVFSNLNANIIFASFGGGYGVVTNNKTREKTYMRMGEVGIGLGLGVKDFRVVFVFHTDAALNRFVEKGWAVGAQADAAAKAGSKGAAIGGETIVDNITIFQLTESGLALQATIKGTKYWKDETLN
ncbi:MAG: hypothetical protein JKY51_02180 [Opitutaceae bacterium]|nr:hypothetical protein [Opitutaceae bacterium]